MTQTYIKGKLLERVLSRLDGVRDLGSGQRKALCPAHNDKNPSLSIKEDDDGTVVLNCFAGCATEDVISTIGLEMRDLFPENDKPRRSPRGKLTKTWEIRHRSGKLVAYHDRFDEPNGDKRCLWKHPNGKYSKNGEIKTETLPLYGSERVAEWPAGASIVMVEGEPAKDALEAAGIRALATVTGASGTPSREVLRVCEGRPVRIWPDNDDEGREHMLRVGEILEDIAAEVYWFEWEDAPHKGDAADHPAVKARNPEATRTLKQHLKDGSIYFRHTHGGGGVNKQGNESGRPITAAELMDMEFEPPRWVVQDVLPEGLSLLAGKPKKGKSWMALGMCEAVSVGDVALGIKRVDRGETLYLALEDNKKRLQKRLKKVLDGRPAPETMHLHTEWPRLDEGGAEQLDEWLTEHPEARLVVIDTLAKIRKPARGANVYAEDYAALELLLPLAAKHGVAIVVVHHLRKMAASDPMDEISSSTGLTAGVDGFLILRRTPGSKGPTLHVDGRDIEEPTEYALHWNLNTATWTIEGEAEEVHLSKERADILLVLNRNPDPMPPKEVAEAMPGAKYNNVKYLMWTMLGDGQLIKDDKGRYSPANPTNPTNPANRTNSPSVGGLAKDDGATNPVKAHTYGENGGRVSGVSGVSEDTEECIHGVTGGCWLCKTRPEGAA